MSKLIREMLTIARDETREFYDMEKVDLVLLTEVAVEELQGQADQKNIQFLLLAIWKFR